MDHRVAGPGSLEQPLSENEATAGRRARIGGFTLIELVIVVGIVGILAAVVLPLGHWSVKRQKEYELQASLRILRDAIDRYHDLALAGLIEVNPGDTGYPPDLQVLVDGVAITAELPSPLPGVSDAYSASGAGLTGGMSGRMQPQGSAAAGGGAAAGGRGNAATGPEALAGAAGSTLEELRGLLGERTFGGRGGLSGLGAGQAAPGGRESALGFPGIGDRAALADRRPGSRGNAGIEKLVLLRRIPVDPFTGEADWGLRCYGDSVEDRSWCGRNVFDVYSTAPGAGIDGRRYREW